MDIIEAGFPIASEADAEAVRHGVDGRCTGPVIAALARCRPATSIAPAGRSSRRARRRIHTFIATSDLHLERKLRMTREACLDAAVAAVHRARRYTDDVAVLGRGRDAQRPGLPLPGRRGGDRRRVHHGQPARHRRLFDAGRDRRVLPHHPRRACRMPDTRDLQRALPRRPRAGGGEHAGGGRRRRRQVECTINGIGERAGNASLEEIVMATRVRADLLPFETGIETREIYADQPDAHGAHRRERSRRTRRSSAATPSRTRPASIRTAC